MPSLFRCYLLELAIFLVFSFLSVEGSCLLPGQPLLYEIIVYVYITESIAQAVRFVKQLSGEGGVKKRWGA